MVQVVQLKVPAVLFISAFCAVKFIVQLVAVKVAALLRGPGFWANVIVEPEIIKLPAVLLILELLLVEMVRLEPPLA